MVQSCGIHHVYGDTDDTRYKIQYDGRAPSTSNSIIAPQQKSEVSST